MTQTCLERGPLSKWSAKEFSKVTDSGSTGTANSERHAQLRLTVTSTDVRP